MIKEDKVLVKINYRNMNHYKLLGYSINIRNISESGEEIVNVTDVPKGSKIKITAVCDICGKEKIIPILKYYANFNRNNKGYYSCFGCKNIEKEKTCLIKYGVKSYSQTTDFKITESIKWKGIQKGSEKGKKTMLEKYGVDSYFKTDIMKEQNKKWMSSNEFKEKSKESLIFKYGVDSYSKTDEFKKNITLNKDIINEKIRKTFLEKYGVDAYSKTNEFKINYHLKYNQIRELCKKTCMEKYRVDNVSKINEIMNKILSTKEYKGQIIPNSELSEWEIYKKLNIKLTKRVKKELYEKWDGYDYYDNEFIKGYVSYGHLHRFYPTIDHKISVFYGFSNKIPPSEISDISNLCITKRCINSTKRDMIESEFNKSF